MARRYSPPDGAQGRKDWQVICAGHQVFRHVRTVAQHRPGHSRDSTTGPCGLGLADEFLAEQLGHSVRRVAPRTEYCRCHLWRYRDGAELAAWLFAATGKGQYSAWPGTTSQ